jgi:amino acid permease
MNISCWFITSSFRKDIKPSKYRNHIFILQETNKQKNYLARLEHRVWQIPFPPLISQDKNQLIVLTSIFAFFPHITQILLHFKQMYVNLDLVLS